MKKNVTQIHLHRRPVTSPFPHLWSPFPMQNHPTFLSHKHLKPHTFRKLDLRFIFPALRFSLCCKPQHLSFWFPTYQSNDSVTKLVISQEVRADGLFAHSLLVAFCYWASKLNEPNRWISPSSCLVHWVQGPLPGLLQAWGHWPLAHNFALQLRNSLWVWKTLLGG